MHGWLETLKKDIVTKSDILSKQNFWQKMILWNHTRNQHNHPPEWMTDIHGWQWKTSTVSHQ